MTRTILPLLALLAAGCSDEPAAPADERGGAVAGEVLPGSISDAMIPLDQIDSQAPLAPRQGPAVNDIDAEQPEVVPADGINDPVEAEAAEAAPAAPTPENPPAG